MTRNNLIYLNDMIENMEKAQCFTESMGYEDFIADEKTSYAVIRCIEIMGEAAKHIPDDIRKLHPDIPWKDIAGMRDKVIHFYFGVNLERVWMVIKEDIPQIRYAKQTGVIGDSLKPAEDIVIARIIRDLSQGEPGIPSSIGFMLFQEYMIFNRLSLRTYLK